MLSLRVFNDKFMRLVQMEPLMVVGNEISIRALIAINEMNRHNETGQITSLVYNSYSLCYPLNAQ